MPRSLRDRGARNTDRALRLSRRIGRVNLDSVYVCATRWLAHKRKRDGEQLLHRQVDR